MIPFCDNLVTTVVEDDVLRNNLLSFEKGSLLGCACHIRPWENKVMAELWSLSSRASPSRVGG